jgi:phage shock protein C
MTAPNGQPTPERQRRLRRLTGGRILGGVAAGLAEYFAIDVTVVRVGFVVLCLLGGMAIPLYIAGWFLIPEEGTDSTIATDLLSRASVACGGA